MSEQTTSYLVGYGWTNASNVVAVTYTCGYCGSNVGSDKGYFSTGPDGRQAMVRICPVCVQPSFFHPGGARVPGTAPGNAVKNVPGELESLFNEARRSTAAGSFTAAVLVCRKMLMNIAVNEGAEVGKPFVYYVQHLSDNGFVPPNGHGWVDYIRRKGNEATHEIQLMTENDAISLVRFVEMLLRFIYEFPNLVPKSDS